MEYTFGFDSVMSPDGRTRHLHFKLALDEALRPSDPTNVASHQKTVEYLMKCAAAIYKMEDHKLAITDKLTALNGRNAFGNNSQAHAGKFSST